MDQSIMARFTERAARKERSRAEERDFTLPGGDVLHFVKPTQAAQLEYYEGLAESKSVSDMLELCTAIIYDCCPAMQDPEMHTAIGLAEPYDRYDAVRKLLDVREIDVLGGELLTWMGIMGESAEDTVKNA